MLQFRQALNCGCSHGLLHIQQFAFAGRYVGRAHTEAVFAQGDFPEHHLVVIGKFQGLRQLVPFLERRIFGPG